MTQGPDDEQPTPAETPDPGTADQPPPPPPPAPSAPAGEEPTQPFGQTPPPTPPQPGYQPPPSYQPPQPGFPAGAYGASPQAPYGIHPGTGLPYSDKQKLIAGLLQILIPLGIGRFYIGDTKTGVWQLVVTLLTCGIGGLWPFIDGIIIIASDSKDVNGLPLR